MAKWVDQGETDVLKVYFSGEQAHRTTLYLGLYLNATEPAENATLADITEPSGGGYARQAIADSEWTVSGNLAQAATKTFQASGADWGDVTGYFIATSSDNTGILLAVEHFDAAKNIGDGDQIQITAKVTID